MKKRPAASSSADHPSGMVQVAKKRPSATSGNADNPPRVLQAATKKRPATGSGSADGPPLQTQAASKKRPSAANGSFDVPPVMLQNVCIKKPAGKPHSLWRRRIFRRISSKRSERPSDHRPALPIGNAAGKPKGNKIGPLLPAMQPHEHQHNEQSKQHCEEPMPTPCHEKLLTLAGAAVDENGNLLTEVYQDLWPHFCREAPRCMQPDPRRPGVRSTELHANFEGLSTWSDAKGCGWIAKASGEGIAPLGRTRWLSLKRWGSWRLAFLAARLQKEVWDAPKGTIEPTQTSKKRQGSASGQRHRTAEPCQAAEIGQKRGRGQGSASGQRHRTAEPSQAAEIAQKRGRGRPRKDPEAAQASLDSIREQRKRLGQDGAEVAKVRKRRLRTKSRAQLLEWRNTKTTGRGRRGHGSRGARGRPKQPIPPPPPAAEGAVGSQDPRFTHHGAIFGDDGKLDLSAYLDLKDHFVEEDAEEMVHPDPRHPGLQADEVADGKEPAFLRGLSAWSDERGAGWRCIMRVGSSPARHYFSKWKWGSWRMAYMLARTQRDVYLYCFSSMAPNAHPGTSAASSTENVD